MKKIALKKLSLKASEGLLSTATNLTLFTFFLVVESVGTPRSSYGVNLTFESAWSDLADFNYNTIKNSLMKLKQKGLIDYQKKNLEKTLQITKEGRKKIKEFLPTYKSKRSWDGKLYLITYDIEEKNKRDRNLLRKYLLKLGAGQLQKSVYLTPYNPRLVIERFIQERALEAAVIISDLGKGAVIGNETLENLLGKVYNLKKIEEKYKNFIEQYKNRKAKPSAAVFSFLSILQEDPQLPFELLPKGWPSNEAYQIYQKYTPN